MPPGHGRAAGSPLEDLLTAVAERGSLALYEQDAALAYTFVLDRRAGSPFRTALGRTDRDVLSGAAGETVVAAKERVLSTGEAATFEVVVPGQDGDTVQRLDVAPLRSPDGSVRGLATTALDVTRERRIEEMRAETRERLARTVQRFDIALRSTGGLVLSLDRDLAVVWANGVGGPFGPTVGRRPEDLFAAETAARFRRLTGRVLATGEAAFEEMRLETRDGRVRWYELSVEPSRGAGRAIDGLVVAAVDRTGAHETTRRLRFLMRELSHRSKNLLSVVQAIARQTAATTDALDVFMEGFSSRLRALAAAQDLLVDGEWSGARLDDLIDAQLGHYLPSGGGRLRVEGPPVRLTAAAAETIGLAFHEMATNAAKYGALSNEEGHVELRWRPAPGGGYAVTWREVGGPPVADCDRRRGFGRIVVERNLAVTLGTDVSLAFEREGVVLSFTIPAGHLAQA